MFTCGSILQHLGGDEDQFGCLRKDNHAGQHLSHTKFGGFQGWETDWNCGCNTEDYCGCAIYHDFSLLQAERILLSDFGEDKEKFPDRLKEAITAIKEDPAPWQK